MKPGVLIAAVIFLAGTGLGDAQTVYKSIGPDGNIVFSDHPPADGKIEKTYHFVDLPSSPVPDLPATAPVQSKPKAAPARAMAPSGNVVMYSATWCGYCKRAKAYLAKKGIGYTNVDIDTADGRAAFSQAGKGGVPLLFVGSRHIRGFTPEGYDAFFAAR